MLKLIDLLANLPNILPGAIAWAEDRAEEVAASGKSLDDSGISLAQAVGVQHPERIRYCFVENLPLPEDPVLREAALQTGLLGPHMVALTLGYSVMICHGHLTVRLMSHEFRHVYQYELYGGISAFLPVYLQQIIEFKYSNCPFEIDAREHEVNNSTTNSG